MPLVVIIGSPISQQENIALLMVRGLDYEKTPGGARLRVAEGTAIESSTLLYSETR
jgi:hypothetical protein